jgi:hypothetical protein
MKKLLALLVIAAAVGFAAAQDPFQLTDQIRFTLVSMSLSKNGPPHETRLFRPGQTVWINLQVRGLKKSGAGDVVFQSDLLLTRENGEVVLDKKNILNMKLSAASIPAPVVTANYNIDLYENIKDDRYKVDIVMRDLVSMKANRYQTTFRVER